MPYPPHSRPTLAVWARLAAWLSFLAVLSALWAPVSALAQDVRSGQLSGICSVNTHLASAADAGLDDAPPAGAHCNLCASLGWASPPLAVLAIPSFPGLQVAEANVPANLTAAIPGLPFSRGPPAL